MSVKSMDEVLTQQFYTAKSIESWNLDIEDKCIAMGIMAALKWVSDQTPETPMEFILLPEQRGMKEEAKLLDSENK